MDAMQISLMGEDVPIQIPEPHKPPSRKFRTMQQLHGITKGKICGECEHFVRRRWSKVYFKCELWHMSSSAASDIRKNAEVCGLWAKAKEGGAEDGKGTLSKNMA